MSYILDALRKSEQERQRGRVPDIHGGALDGATEQPKKNYWPAITVAVVVVNAVLLVFFWSRLQGDTPAVPVATQPQPAPHIAQPTAPPAPVSPAPANMAPPSTPPVPPPVVAPVISPAPVKPANPVASAPKPVPPPAPEPIRIDPKPRAQATSQPAPAEAAPVPSVGYLPQLEELPPHEREGIPDMTFSSHMYSSMPKFRSIIINGKRLKEGQYFNDQLQVREITESGVVLSRGSTLFEVDVLGRWAQ